jgi:hypothetical protein
VNQLFNFWLSKITKVPPAKNQWNSLTSGIRQWDSVRAWEDVMGKGEKRYVDQINRCGRYYYKYISLLGPPKEVMIRLHQHHSKTSVYMSMAKWKGAHEYRREMINKVCPFWVHGSGGDFHQCLKNALTAACRRKANKENAYKRANGKSPKKAPKVVPNWFWYTVFLYPNISGGKINPTPNRGPNEPAHIDQHKTQSTLREETKVKSKGKTFTQQENEGRSIIVKNKTHVPVGAAVKEP